MRQRPFKLTMPEASETEIHEICAKALDGPLGLAPPAVWTCFPAGHIKLSPQQAARLSRAGLKRGWPDILIVYEALVFGIELKKRGGKLSKTRVGRTRSGAPRVYEGQQDVFPRLQSAGMAIAVVDGVEAMLRQCRRWGLPMRAQVADNKGP
jgi:hypothetical protein